MKKNNKKYLVIDFDSTFVKCEALPELAEICLFDHPEKDLIKEEIEKITDMGMEGKISFPESLQKRLSALPLNKKHIEALSERLKKNITDSILRNKEIISKKANDIFIISGGFRDFILPITREFAIPDENVLANNFIYNKRGQVIGFDENNFLAQEQGKVKQMQALNLHCTISVVGDGWSDYEIRAAGLADEFFAFTENIKRSKVVRRADKIAENFDRVVSECKLI